jgi:hypothetical protein
MCYVITDRGRALLADRGLWAQSSDARGAHDTRRPRGAGEQLLRQARHEVHVAGWALALSGASAAGSPTPRGGAQAVLSPPTRATARGRVALGPADLRLPGGRVPHDFLRSLAGGERVEVEHFQTLRPDAIVPLAQPAHDVIVERDDRLRSPSWLSKLERYDHFLSGWAAHTSRYGRRLDAAALVVFVCRDRIRARECARRADMALRACRAYAGEYPLDWQYPGREGVLFVAERDLHEGLRFALGVPRLPPDVRVSSARGDPSAGEATAEPRVLPG